METPVSGHPIPRYGDRIRALLTIALVLLLTVAAFALGDAGAGAEGSAGVECPQAPTLTRPENPRGAIPAAKAYSFGDGGRVTKVARGDRSTYAAAARGACGEAVLKDSVYVQVHPVGMRCSACDAHLYLVKPERAPWKVWIAY